MTTPDTRQRLVQAMSESIREHGVGTSSMADVLERAGVSAGSMYHFFPDGKDELTAASVREIGMLFVPLLESILADSPSVADGTVTYYSMVIGEQQRHRFRYGCPVGVPSAETSGSNETVRQAAADVFGAWIDTIAAGLVKEGWPPGEAASAARASIATYEGASMLARTLHDTRVISDSLEIMRLALSRPPSSTLGSWPAPEGT